MEITISNATISQFKGVVVTHLDESIHFAAHSKTHCGTTKHDLFEHVNEYFSSMSEQKQADLFELFRKAKTILDPNYAESQGIDDELLRNHRDYRFLIDRLTPIIRGIYQVIDLRNYTYFLKQSGVCAPPRGLKETVARGEYHAEQTINPTEYEQIAELALLMRPSFPIISGMMQKAKEITGDEYKEVVTAGLFKDMDVFVNHHGWNKIRNYMNYFYSSNGVNSLQLSLISEDSYVNHAFYSALFSRLGSTHIPSKDNSKNIAKSLYSVAKQYSAPSSRIREKKLTAKDEMNEKRSLYEIYFLKEEVSSADEEAHGEFFSMGLYDNQDRPKAKERFDIACLGLGIQRPDLVEWVYDQIPSNWEFELQPHIFKLLQLAFPEHISYNIYLSLDHDQLMSAMALATVKLHEAGYLKLATLVCTVYDEDQPRSLTDEIFSLDTADKEMLEDLCAVYRGHSGLATDNEAVIAANDFLKELGNGQWSSIIEPGMLDDPEVMKNADLGDLFEVELDRSLKTEFLDLVKQVNS
ncbi:hypothetical protein [Vibrio phage phiKT1028]|nr:hypothetical protein [Vibrio phage phiKT1028]